ncbi:hypothetical protein [Taklimakanibacter deserti]|uniref:hypothetical protein n=1 Tax=Taklimakanibacter deserti TaxID=2267839 RepID=UPI000E646AA1
MTDTNLTDTDLKVVSITDRLKPVSRNPKPRNEREPEELPPLIEALVVSTCFITGGALEVTDTCVRLVGWETLPIIEGGAGERRVITRIAMSTDTARDLMAGLRSALAKGGH